MILFFVMFGCANEETIDTEYSVEAMDFQVMKSSHDGGLGWNYPQTSLLPLQLDNNSETVDEAILLFQSNKDREVIELLIPYTRQSPKDALAHSLISVSFFRMKDILQANLAAKNVVDLHPTALSVVNYAITLQFLNRVEEAEVQYKRALILDRKNFLAIRNLVSFFYSQRNLEECAYYLKEMIKVDPNDSYAFVSLGQVYVELGRYEEAETIYRFRLKELDLQPESDQKLAGGRLLDLPLALGRVCLIQGDFPCAKEWLEYTIVQSKDREGAWTNEKNYEIEAQRTLAGVALEEGDIALAKELISQSITTLQLLVDSNIVTHTEELALMQGLHGLEEKIKAASTIK